MTDTSYVADLQAKNIFRPSQKAIRRAALAIVAALGVAGAVHFGHRYWTVGRYLESTDDAYVKADSTIISPRVSGYIAKVLVSDNQTVKAGQILARIDDHGREGLSVEGVKQSHIVVGDRHGRGKHAFNDPRLASHLGYDPADGDRGVQAA